ncbi:MAG TPA: glycosyltransferase family 2 protein [Nanoarchaeota archaeon]|nr:glycosyltransferase family 2 protein [Nanoarchaeota archaeon]
MLYEMFFYPAIVIGLFTTTFFLMTFFEDFGREKRRPDYQPKVTVCVPTWNDAETIANTIQSLLNLDYPKEKLEIIVVENNGSTDGTLEVARKFESQGVRVFSIKEGGKGFAMNFAIKQATGEIFGALDSDSIVAPDALKNMVPLFSEEKVAAVTPTLKVNNPKGMWHYIQSVEYIYGVFLRKVFALLDSIHVTPGPFTLYRIDFFRKHGGYDIDNITEDMEVALRIQSVKLRIENAIDANVYTTAPNDFVSLFKQRTRWYLGLLDNVPRYKHLFSPEYGILGLFILPLSFYSIFFAIAMLFYQSYIFATTGLKQLSIFNAVNFDVIGLASANPPAFYLAPNIFTAMSVIVLAMGIIAFYLALRYSKDSFKPFLSYIIYYPFYLIVFALWWLSAIYCKLFAKELRFGGVVWRNSLRNKLLHDSA